MVSQNESDERAAEADTVQAERDIATKAAAAATARAEMAGARQEQAIADAATAAAARLIKEAEGDKDSQGDGHRFQPTRGSSYMKEVAPILMTVHGATGVEEI